MDRHAGNERQRALEKTLFVTFFGRFTLSRTRWRSPDAVSAPERSSRRLWTFLQYLCAFHQKGANQEELIEALWGDSEVVDPVGALKTILHRARALLEDMGFPDGKQILLYRRGRYSWSSDLEFHMDTEELDRLYARFATAPADSLPEVLAFLPQYDGDFLPNTEETWALSLRTFYHTRYLQISLGAANLLRAQGRFGEAIGLCRTATTLDPYDERCQLLLIRLLYDSGAAQAALRHYSTVSELYMDQLGVSPSPEMLALYQDISKAGRGERLELHTLREQLLEKGHVTGPFFCEYAVFQDIYRLIARSMPRSGDMTQLALLTITESAIGPMDAKQRIAAMEALRDSGLSMLRPGDVVTRAGPSQVLLLLSSTTRERAEAALHRILSAFEHTLIGKRVGVQISLLPVLAAGTGEEKETESHV